jgi:hypothetical protein
MWRSVGKRRKERRDEIMALDKDKKGKKSFMRNQGKAGISMRVEENT